MDWLRIKNQSVGVSVQGCAGVHRGAQVCTGVHRGAQGRTGDPPVSAHMGPALPLRGVILLLLVRGGTGGAQRFYAFVH